jgi:hypothetical protein
MLVPVDEAKTPANDDVTRLDAGLQKRIQGEGRDALPAALSLGLPAVVGLAVDEGSEAPVLLLPAPKVGGSLFDGLLDEVGKRLFRAESGRTEDRDEAREEAQALDQGSDRETLRTFRFPGRSILHPRVCGCQFKKRCEGLFDS